MDKISTIILAASLIIIMLGMGMSLVFEDFKRIFIYPKAIFVGLVNQLIILTIIGFIIVSIFPLKQRLLLGL
jgi:BASS family bile acid:Na+ symporter